MGGDDRLTRLQSARDKLAAAIEDCGGRELPGLVREYRLVLAEIAGLGVGDEVGDVVDQLAKRRKSKTAQGT